MKRPGKPGLFIAYQTSAGEAHSLIPPHPTLAIGFMGWINRTFDGSSRPAGNRGLRVLVLPLLCHQYPDTSKSGRFSDSAQSVPSTQETPGAVAQSPRGDLMSWRGEMHMSKRVPSGHRDRFPGKQALSGTFTPSKRPALIVNYQKKPAERRPARGIPPGGRERGCRISLHPRLRAKTILNSRVQ